MTALSDQLRRAIGAPPPAQPGTLQRLRSAIWEEVAQVERDTPRYQQILQSQQQGLQRQGAL